MMPQWQHEETLLAATLDVPDWSLMLVLEHDHGDPLVVTLEAYAKLTPGSDSLLDSTPTIMINETFTELEPAVARYLALLRQDPTPWRVELML